MRIYRLGHPYACWDFRNIEWKIPEQRQPGPLRFWVASGVKQKDLPDMIQLPNGRWLVKETVVAFLRDKGWRGLEFHEAEVMKPWRRGRESQPFPGPRYRELWIAACVKASLELSTVVAYSEDQFKDVHGVTVDRWEDELDPVNGQMVKRRRSRIPGMGLYIEERQLAGIDFFRVKQLKNLVFCTEGVNEALERAQFDGLCEVLEYGETFRQETIEGRDFDVAHKLWRPMSDEELERRISEAAKTRAEWERTEAARQAAIPDPQPIPLADGTFLACGCLGGEMSGFRGYEVELPPLEGDHHEAHRKLRTSIRDYVMDEFTPAGPMELEFVRSARLNDSAWWLWRFLDDDGKECFAVRSVYDDDGVAVIDADLNDAALTPAQYIAFKYCTRKKP